MTISDPIFTVTQNGVTAPSFPEILEYFKERARGIFGTDINLDDDTQDGQLIALVAAAVHDVNSRAVSVYSAYNPQSAVGVALDSAVKTNGIVRREATYSTVDLTLVGQVGTIIENGVAQDSLQQRWALPERVVIPNSGTITVTATAEKQGAISAASGSITQIATPTLGWQSVTNATAASVGIAEETDAELRTVQEESTMQPSLSLWEGLKSSVKNVDGVVRVGGVKNDTATTDANGVPAHSVALVVDGGAVNDIAECIYKKKGQGVGTYGSTSGTCTDSFYETNTIYFSRPTAVTIAVVITVTAGSTWTSESADAIKQRIVDYIAALTIGESVNIARVLASAILDENNEPDESFSVTAITLNGTAASVTIEWNKVSACTISDVTVTSS